MADRILNIGFIGNGKGTNRYHAPFSLALPDKFRIKTIYARHAGGPWPAIEGVTYTTDIKEHNSLGKIGWKLEGVAWYGVKQ